MNSPGSPVMQLEHRAEERRWIQIEGILLVPAVGLQPLNSPQLPSEEERTVNRVDVSVRVVFECLSLCHRCARAQELL